MKKTIIIALGMCVVLSGYCDAGTYDLEIITYYPAPYGIYEQLQADKLAVGDINEDGKLTGGDIPEDGALAVEDNIYLGKDIVESNRSPEMVVKTPDARPTPFNADTADSDQTVLSIKDKDNKNLFNVDDTGFVEARDYQYRDSLGFKKKVSKAVVPQFQLQCYWLGTVCHCNEDGGTHEGYFVIGQPCIAGHLFPPMVIEGGFTEHSSESCPSKREDLDNPALCTFYYTNDDVEDFLDEVSDFACDNFGVCY